MTPVVGSVVCCAFQSVVGRAKKNRREREAFYRHEVLKKLIEQGGAGGQQVFEMMRKEVELRDRQRREARILGGLITAVIGVSLMILLYVLVPGEGVWSTGLIPFSVGTVILLFAFFTPKTT